MRRPVAEPVLIRALCPHQPIIVSIMLATVHALAMLQEGPSTDSGSHLCYACKNALRFWDGDKSQPRTDAALCVSYFEGFIDGCTWQKESPICMDATAGAIVRIYLNYMDKHPSLFDSPRSLGMVLSLRAACSCKAMARMP